MAGTTIVAARRRSHPNITRFVSHGSISGLRFENVSGLVLSFDSKNAAKLASDAGDRLELSDIETRGNIPSIQRTAKRVTLLICVYVDRNHSTTCFLMTRIDGLID